MNADASEGEVRVELLDASARIVPGFSADRFHPLRSDATYYKLSWDGVSQVGNLIRTGVRIRVFLMNARLYSLWGGGERF